MGLTIMEDMKEGIELLQDANLGLRATIERLDRENTVLRRDLTLARNEIADLKKYLWGGAAEAKEPESAKDKKGGK